MAVEDKRAGEDGAIDRFPIGMRVLAVDDDPICLKVLENLLRKCQYEVTITSQAATALQMLRENKNNYDLVISDVNMPDIDGFKLLELVGLEMDLPVIMLSAYSDTKLVMKGISHGACDYLLKPVRIEELKNIWQHVIRKKKFEPKDQNKSPNEKGQVGTEEGGQTVTSTGNSDQSGKVSRKRKDQDEDEDEEAEEDGNENEDSATQKKPRVVWSVELHKKFVAAVNQLGFEKAVPKKILDLMNVEWLSRENVASHLQKYRLYLKRISQQPNMVAALGGKDPSFMHMTTVDGFGDFRMLNGPGRFSSTSISSSYQPGGILGRMNSNAGLTMRGIASSSVIPSGHSQTLRNSYNALGKLQNSMLPSNQSANFFNGVQTSLEVNQQPHSKSSSQIGELHHINDPTAFTSITSFTDARVTLGSTSSSLCSPASNPLMLQANLQPTQSRGSFGNQSSLGVAPINPGTFNIGVSGSSTFLDHRRHDESWQGANRMSKFPSNSLPMSEPFGNDQLPHTNLDGNLSSQFGNNSLDHSASMAAPIPLGDSRGDMQCQAGGIMSALQNMNYNHSLSYSFSNINSLGAGSCDMVPFSQSLNQPNTVGNKAMDVSLIDQFNGTSTPYISQHTGVEKTSLATKLKPSDDYLFEQNKPQDGFVQNNYESLDDIMNTMMKRDQNDALLGDAEFGCDDYSLGSCI